LLAFQSHITEAPSAILCMGDTIMHLLERRAVESLIERAFAELMPGGKFVVSFRDYSAALRSTSRRLSSSTATPGQSLPKAAVVTHAIDR
jgi:hypothetical protein